MLTRVQSLSTCVWRKGHTFWYLHEIVITMYPLQMVSFLWLIFLGKYSTHCLQNEGIHNIDNTGIMLQRLSSSAFLGIPESGPSQVLRSTQGLWIKMSYLKAFGFCGDVLWKWTRQCQADNSRVDRRSEACARAFIFLTNAFTSPPCNLYLNTLVISS